MPDSEDQAKEFIAEQQRALLRQEIGPVVRGMHLTNAEKVEIIEEGDGVRRVTMERADNIHFETRAKTNRPLRERLR